MIVIDTNVVLSALISSRGYSFLLLEKIFSGGVDYLINEKLLYEYHAVLMRHSNLQRIPLSVSEIEKVLAVLVQNGHHQETFYRWRPNLKDESDNFIFELAIAGQATSIVTFNKADFLNYELKFDLAILTPREFLTKTRST